MKNVGKKLLYLGLSSALFTTIGIGSSNVKADSNKEYYTTQNTKLYQGANSKHSINELNRDSEVNILKTNKNSPLSKIKSGNQIGYVYNNQINPDYHFRPTQTTVGVNMYSTPDLQGNTIETIPANTIINRLYIWGNSLFVQYNGKVGFIDADTASTLVLNTTIENYL